MFQGSTSLKFYKRLKVYKNSTNSVSFDPQTKTGRSYRWQFVGVVKGQLIFNDYNWSPTTSGHQSAMRSVLRELGLSYVSADFGPIDVCYVPNNLNKIYTRIVECEIELETSRQGTYKARSIQHQFERHVKAFETLEQLGFKLNLKAQARIRKDLYEKEFESVNNKEYLKACKALDLKAALTNLNDPTF